MIYRVLAITLLFPFLQGATAPRYAAPYGSGGACTPAEPCALPAALASGGDVWLLPGTYAGAWQIDVAGTTVRSVPGTRARLDLDGELAITAPDVTLRDLEITATGWVSRTSATALTPAPDLPLSKTAITVLAPRAHILYNRIHDLGIEGLGLWKTATDTEAIGNLIYNNGWRGTNRGHGADIYTQNNPDGAKLLKDNILLGSYNKFGLQLYGSDIAPLENYTLDGNIIAASFQAGGSRPIGRMTVRNNLLWQVSMPLGSTPGPNGALTLENNYIAFGAYQPLYWREIAAHGNTAANWSGLQVQQVYPPTTPYTYTIDANTYYSTRPSTAFAFGGPAGDFAAWQARGLDATGVVTSTLPKQPAVFVRPWEPHRGAVVVFNWPSAASVAVDLSALGLTAGAAYQLVNAQNPAEALAFTAGAPVQVPMTGWTTAAPYGAAAPLRAWDRQFGIFLVEPV